MGERDGDDVPLLRHGRRGKRRTTRRQVGRAVARRQIHLQAEVSPLQALRAAGWTGPHKDICRRGRGRGRGESHLRNHRTGSVVAELRGGDVTSGGVGVTAWIGERAGPHLRGGAHRNEHEARAGDDPAHDPSPMGALCFNGYLSHEVRHRESLALFVQVRIANRAITERDPTSPDRRHAGPVRRRPGGGLAADRGADRRRGARRARRLMEFLVRIDVALGAEMAPERRAELLAAETTRGRELRRAGTIQRIWRLPGGLRNVGIWEAHDATELHEAISGLPLYPWIRAEVTALATHPLESGE